MLVEKGQARARKVVDALVLCASGSVCMLAGGCLRKNIISCGAEATVRSKATNGDRDTRTHSRTCLNTHINTDTVAHTNRDRYKQSLRYDLISTTAKAGSLN